MTCQKEWLGVRCKARCVYRDRGIPLARLQRRCTDCRKHEEDGTEPKYEKDETGMCGTSAASSKTKRHLQHSLETEDAKKNQK